MKDELPETEVQILIYSNLGFDIAERNTVFYVGKWVQREDLITHWMPLPEPPEAQ